MARILSARIDVNQINHMRPILQTISAICEKYDCGLILISHINKKPQENANNATLGSVDLVNASRSALTNTSKKSPTAIGGGMNCVKKLDK